MKQPIKKGKVDRKNLKLDPYEKKMEKIFDPDNFKVLPKQDENLLMQFREAARNYNEKKKKMISIRTSENDLEQFKKESNKLGLPYQTVINMLIGMVAKGDLKLREDRKGKVTTK